MKLVRRILLPVVATLVLAASAVTTASAATNYWSQDIPLPYPDNWHCMTKVVGDADVDVHLLAGTPTADACVARGDTAVDRQLAPGTYYLVADTYAGNAGDYTIVVMAD